MTHKEVMQQALEALEISAVTVDSFRVQKATQEAITALRTALEQPEQEPTYKVTVVDNQHPNGVPYEQWATPPAAQREWQGLTNKEFLEACQLAERGNYLVAFQRIQAKLKERNT